MTRVESLITIPSLGTGGSIAYELDDSVMLDTGYLLKKNNSRNVTDVRMLSGYNLAVKISSEETTSPAVERLAGSAARALAILESRIL